MDGQRGKTADRMVGGGSGLADQGPGTSSAACCEGKQIFVTGQLGEVEGEGGEGKRMDVAVTLTAVGKSK